MQINTHAGLEGLFHCYVRNAEGEVVKQSGESGNIILDAGLTRMSQGRWLEKCVVGSGNSTPTETQTDLDNPVAVTTNEYSKARRRQVDETPFYQEFSLTYRFGEGAAAGNLAEVAVGWGNQLTGSLFDRALIRDANGVPTTIQVLDNEYLDVVFTLRVYYEATHKLTNFNLVDQTGAVISTHEAEMFIEFYRPFLDRYYNNLRYVYGNGVRFPRFGGTYQNAEARDSIYSSISNLGTELQEISGSVAGTTSGIGFTSEYPDSRTYIGTFILGINDMNGTFQGARIVTSLGFVKFAFTPEIAKDNTETLRIRLKMTWGRYVP